MLPEDRYTVEPRSIVVLKAMKDPDFQPKKKVNKRHLKQRPTALAKETQTEPEASGGASGQPTTEKMLAGDVKKHPSDV